MAKNNAEMSISDLRAAIDRILAHVEDDLGVKSIKLEHDYYWKISDEQVFSMEREPSSVNVGSLFEDIENLKKVLEGDVHVQSIMLRYAAPLLHYVSGKIDL